MAKKSKNSVAAKRQYDKSALYGPEDAVGLVRSMAFAKFDESIDVVFTLGIDARKADQLVRGTVSLPHGTGKEVRVVAFVGGEKLAEAEEAGADIVGGKELAEEIAAGRELDFDIAIAAPDMMVAAAQWSDAADAAAEQSLDDAAEIARELGAEVTPHQRGGDPADQLLDVCEETDADLLVVGNRGMHGARRFLLGSVSSRCAHHANTSVLVVQTT